MANTVDYPDFTQPVALIEQVSGNLIPGGAVNIGASTPQIDSSNYASIAIAITLPNALISTPYAMKLLWYEGADVYDSETITFHSGPTYGNFGNALYWQLPVRGSLFTLTAQGSVVNAIAVTAVGSNRVVNSASVQTSNVIYDRSLMSGPAVSIAPGQDYGPYWIPPVSRAYCLTFGASVANPTYSVLAIACNNGAFGYTNLLSGAITSGYTVFSDFVLPGSALQVSMHNSTAAATYLLISVMDVS